MGTIVGKNGTYEEYEDDLFKGNVPIQGDPSKDGIDDSLHFIAPKIPLPIYQEMLRFFEWCYRKKNSEGMLLIMLRNGQWSIDCPKQYNGPAHVCAHPEKEASRFHGSVGDIHSHPGMGWSGHSTIDDADERKYNHGIYMVVSSDRHQPFSIFSNQITIYGYARGVKYEFDPEVIFDLSVAPGEGEFPAEWQSRVHNSFNCKICPKKHEPDKKDEDFKSDKTDVTPWFMLEKEKFPTERNPAIPYDKDLWLEEGEFQDRGEHPHGDFPPLH